MTDIQVFRNEQFGEVRTIDENGVTIFCAAEVFYQQNFERSNAV